MASCNTASSSPKTSPQKALEYTHVCLKTARETNELELALVLCNDAEASLSQVVKKVPAMSPKNGEDPTLREGIAAACFELGKLQEQLGLGSKANISYKKAEKWG